MNTKKIKKESVKNIIKKTKKNEKYIEKNGEQKTQTDKKKIFLKVVSQYEKWLILNDDRVQYIIVEKIVGNDIL
jgi:histidinol phosphatase-like PHP family hydrolase